MLFNSIHFLIFFPIVIATYFLIPNRFRNLFLIASSYYFYMCWKPAYLILIVVSTVIDYTCGIMMGRESDRRKRLKFLLLSLTGNLGLLFSFKYFNFFNDSLSAILSQFNVLYDIQNLNVLLPVGISFYTFQTLSYSIEVFKGKQKPERNFVVFALYVSFFPQLVAGPIERSTRLLPQFFIKHEFDYDRVVSGLRLMLWGFFKKVVIADSLALMVNKIYNNPEMYSGMYLWIATYFFAYQIYCDFSGYSDIAIGTARVMGYELMENFRRPYFARSIAEFWKRWHISLSTWFRDYLYISLGGNRVAKWRWYLNLMFTFLVSGLWHGANWTFVLWGALNGFYLVFSILSENIRTQFNKLTGLTKIPVFHTLLKRFITFHLAVFAWIFFRANNVSDAFLIIGKILSFNTSSVETVLPLTINQLLSALFFIGIMELVQVAQEMKLKVSDFRQIQPWMRWGIYYFLIAVILVFGQFGDQEFIYFQF